jgi:hypothetical protein
VGYKRAKSGIKKAIIFSIEENEPFGTSLNPKYEIAPKYAKTPKK